MHRETVKQSIARPTAINISTQKSFMLLKKVPDHRYREPFLSLNGNCIMRH